MPYTLRDEPGFRRTVPIPYVAGVPWRVLNMHEAIPREPGEFNPSVANVPMRPPVMPWGRYTAPGLSGAESRRAAPASRFYPPTVGDLFPDLLAPSHVGLGQSPTPGMNIPAPGGHYEWCAGFQKWCKNNRVFVADPVPPPPPAAAPPPPTPEAAPPTMAPPPTVASPAAFVPTSAPQAPIDWAAILAALKPATQSAPAPLPPSSIFTTAPESISGAPMSAPGQGEGLSSGTLVLLAAAGFVAFLAMRK